MRVPFERCATSRSCCTKKRDSQGLRPAPQREPTHPESMPSAKNTSCKPLPSTDLLGAHLDYFRIVGKPELIRYTGRRRRSTSGKPVIRAQSQADKADYIPTGRLHITGSNQTLTGC